jgi:proline utilization trans-activator
MPRKQRIHGSVEMLSLRYRALDALVKGLFPDQSTEDTDTLFRIADAHNIPMPSSDEQSPVVEVLKQSPSENSPPTVPSLPASQEPTMPSPPHRGNPFTGRSARVVEEKLIPNHHGISHYVGPSSSFGFAMELRALVAQRDAGRDSRGSDRRHSTLQSEFSRLQMSKALEPQAAERGSETVDDVAVPAVEESMPRNRRQRPGRQQLSSGSVTPSPNRPIASLLPEKEVADALVEEFFDKVHPNYLLFHCGTFHVRYEELWNPEMSQQNKVEPGWICCVFMVFVFGAQALEQHDADQASNLQRRYFTLVQSKLHQLINTTSLTNIQALLLLQLYQHNSCQRNAAWMLLGCASRMACALGMHRQGAVGTFDPIERQVRRRVWWTMYQFEQDLCMVLGRPSAIEDLEVDIGLPNEKFLDGTEGIPSSYLDHSVRLTRIAKLVKRTMYATPSQMSPPADLPEPILASSLLAKLDSWYHELPPPLQLQCTSVGPKQRRAILLLHIHYHHIASLITRSYLLRKVKLKLGMQLGQGSEHPELSEAELALSHTCGNSAREAMTLFHELALNGLLEGVAWLDVYYAYHGVLVLSMDFIYRPIDEDSTEDLARKAVVRDVLNVTQNVKLCRTLHVLAKVAAQFANTVDILEETGQEGEVEGDAHTAKARNVAQMARGHESRFQSGVGSGIGNSVPFQALPDPVWDFVDVWGDTFNNTLTGIPYQEATMSGFDRFGGSNHLPLDYMGFNVENNM